MGLFGVPLCRWSSAAFRKMLVDQMLGRDKYEKAHKDALQDSRRDRKKKPKWARKKFNRRIVRR